MVRSTRFQALGSVAAVAVTEPARLATALEAVKRTVAQFDLACSRFRSDSELSALNAAAGTTVTVGPVLLVAVQAALRAARLTDGDVDPTVGQALVALGYDRDFAELEQVRGRDGRAPGVRIAAVPGCRAVEVDPARRTIRVPVGVKLDLGATAKALAADHAATRAGAAAGCGVLVALGGDIALAGAAPEEGWPIRVTDDHRAGVDAPGQWIVLREGGLATSSTTVRAWEGRHHLVDPATSLPARVVWRTVSVCAASCLDANIASTAAVIRGARAPGWLRSLSLPSRLVAAGGHVLHLGGWPTAGDDLPTAGDDLPAADGDLASAGSGPAGATTIGISTAGDDLPATAGRAVPPRAEVGA